MLALLFTFLEYFKHRIMNYSLGYNSQSLLNRFINSGRGGHTVLLVVGFGQSANLKLATIII